MNLIKFQTGKVTAFKYVYKNGESPIQDTGKINYEVGKIYTEKDLDKSEFLDCGRGLNVADLGWCLRNMNLGEHKLLEVEFLAKDIVAIPFNTDGKFRIKKLKVVREWTKAKIKKYMDMKIK